MSMYGRKYWGALRATFVIDGSGTVVHVIPRVTPRTHDDEVLGALERLAAA
jgi:thioredoxin-dependent peroxiredoxin